MSDKDIFDRLWRDVPDMPTRMVGGRAIVVVPDADFDAFIRHVDATSRMPPSEFRQAPLGGSICGTMFIPERGAQDGAL